MESLNSYTCSLFSPLSLFLIAHFLDVRGPMHLNFIDKNTECHSKPNRFSHVLWLIGLSFSSLMNRDDKARKIGWAQFHYLSPNPTHLCGACYTHTQLHWLHNKHFQLYPVQINKSFSKFYTRVFQQKLSTRVFLYFSKPF